MEGSGYYGGRPSISWMSEKDASPTHGVNGKSSCESCGIYIATTSKGNLILSTVTIWSYTDVPRKYVVGTICTVLDEINSYSACIQFTHEMGLYFVCGLIELLQHLIYWLIAKQSLIIHMNLVCLWYREAEYSYIPYKIDTPSWLI